MTKKRIFVALLGALSTAAFVPSMAFAQAAEENRTFGDNITANVGFYSDYAFRGISQTDEKASLQGGFDYEDENGIYAGIWASNVDFNEVPSNNGATMEVDLYGGYNFALDEKTSLSLGGVYYYYEGASSSLDYDFYELNVGLGHDYRNISTSAQVSWSPNFFADSGDAFYFEAAAEMPVMENLTAGAHVGYQTIEKNGAIALPDYMDYSIGLNYAWEGFDFGVHYIDTDIKRTELADGADERIVFSISRSF